MREKLWNEIKKDKEIWIGTLICAIVFSIYIGFSEFSNSRFFSILTNLSFSYIAAVIFYIVQVKLPDKQKKERALLTFQGELSNIYDELEMIIIYIEEFWKIEEEKVTIKGLDNDMHYYLYERNGSKRQEFINYKEYIPRHIEQIKNNIEKAKKGRLYQYLPEKLIDTISELENADFSLIKSVQNDYLIDIKYIGLQSNIDQIKEYRNIIMSYVKNKDMHKIRCLNDDEIKEYKKQIALFYQEKQRLNENEEIVLM